jgi:hypothetical protein
MRAQRPANTCKKHAKKKKTWIAIQRFFFGGKHL